MAHISGFERDQLLLLPEAVDDYVGPDNPVRFIDAFVDGLDLVEAGFGRVQPKATGRPGYAPSDLLKLYIYGYLNRVRSSRRLEAECHRNIEVIWLLRTLKPDFKTIADFRADNRAAFKAVFRAFTLLCKRRDLFGRELLAVDGTRIKAVNNKDRNFTRNSLETFLNAADERLADYLTRLDQGDAAEKATGGARVKNLAEKIEALSKKRGKYDAMLKQLECTGEDQISFTDPDSRAMAAHTRVAVGYNVQVAVDAKHKLIVEQEVTNQVVDTGLLQATAEPAREILGVERIDVVADIMLCALKMHGMAQAVGELTEQGSPAFEAALPILSQLLKAETADREVRSTAYQLKAARDRLGCRGDGEATCERVHDLLLIGALPVRLSTAAIAMSGICRASARTNSTTSVSTLQRCCPTRFLRTRSAVWSSPARRMTRSRPSFSTRTTISSISMRAIRLRVATVAPGAFQARSTSAPNLSSASRSAGLGPGETAASSASSSFRSRRSSFRRSFQRRSSSPATKRLAGSTASYCRRACAFSKLACFSANST